MIRFECSCGKRLKVRAADIGHTVECPNCAAQLVVPDPDALPVAEEAASAPDALAAAMRELAPTAARPSKIPTKKTPPAAPGRSPRKPGAQPAQIVSAAHKPVIIGVAAALALAVLLLILSFFAGGDNKPAKKEGPPTIQAPPSPPPTTTSGPERNLHPPGDLFPKVAPTN